MGALITNSTFDVGTEQRDTWLVQLKLLRSALSSLDGSIFLEFSIPRIGRRIDAVVIVGAAIFAIEFKVGAQVFSRTAREQVWDYALDLKNFHEASHAAQIVPILVRTGSDVWSEPMLKADSDGAFRPILVGGDGMRPAIDLALATIINPPIDVAAWSIAPYRPTPTIIEAARALYAQHSVEAIARHDGGREILPSHLGALTT